MMHELYINDVPAYSFGVWLAEMPTIPTGRERGERLTMPGKDGTIFNSDGGRESVEITLQLYVEPNSDIEDVKHRLMNAERIRITPYNWEWRVDVHETAPEINEWFIPGEGWDIEVTFTADPYRYVYPRGGLNVTYNGGYGVYTINNPYKADALPIITAEATSTSSLRNEITVNDVVIQLFPRTQKINVIDSLNRELDAPADIILTGNDGIRPQFPVLKPGDNKIIINDINLKSVNIKADWRLL